LYGRYPDDEAGEIPMEFILRKSDNNLFEEDVKKFVANQVNETLRYLVCELACSQPKTLVSFVGDLLISKRKYLLCVFFSIQEDTSSSICQFNSQVPHWKDIKKIFDS